MDNQDYLLVGLGNPGDQYRYTRHNIGFQVIDHYLERIGTVAYSEKWQAEYAMVVVGDIKLHLVKPLTYMNLSGKAVAQFSRFYKVPPNRILIVHDDLDMHPGRVKLVKGGGAGGHNGIKSLVEWLGTGEFYRLKIGIGRPGKGEIHPLFPVDRYVLSEFGESEVKLLQERLPHILDGITSFLRESPAKAMGFLNLLK